MISTFKNSALSAKVRGKRKRNLTAADYAAMAELRGVAQVTAYLKNNTSYADVLSGINENYIHRRQLESILRQSISRDYASLRHFLSGKGRGFFRLLENKAEEGFDPSAFKAFTKHLRGGDKAAALHAFGMEVDLANIALIIRSKKYYSLAAELIFPYIIPNYYKISRNDIKEMVEAETMDGVFDVLRRTAYKDAFANDAEFLEKGIKRFSLAAHRKTFKKFPYSLAAPLMYVYEKEIEIQNIVSIIEGIRYGLPPEEVIAHIILGKENPLWQ